MQGRNLNLTKSVHINFSSSLDKGNHSSLGDESVFTRRGGGRKGMVLEKSRASPSDGWDTRCVGERQGAIIILMVVVVVAAAVVVVIPAIGTLMLTVCQTQCVNYLINSLNNRLICAITYRCVIHNDNYVPFLSLDHR